jgi:hypothetical protein
MRGTGTERGWACFRVYREQLELRDERRNGDAAGHRISSIHKQKRFKILFEPRPRISSMPQRHRGEGLLPALDDHDRSQSSSANRVTAGASGFFAFTQSRDCATVLTMW